ncbi:hypothetical protein BDV93DRAFT_559489 [Ceratobasidium sp. AG-I]|nr:hypothetical protein BDV93DRAFT_559489 [Ceratobasidium sp. AG-I]
MDADPPNHDFLANLYQIPLDHSNSHWDSIKLLLHWFTAEKGALVSASASETRAFLGHLWLLIQNEANVPEASSCIRLGLQDVRIESIAICRSHPWAPNHVYDPTLLETARGVKEVVCIRDEQLTASDDMERVLKKQWINTGIMAAWSAACQDRMEKLASGTDCWIFSPWLAVLANRSKYKEDPQGDISSHVAGTIIHNTLNELYTHAKLPIPKFETWKTSCVWPVRGVEQQNGWACGYFAMLAIDTRARGWDLLTVAAGCIEWVRWEFARIYLGLRRLSDGERVENSRKRRRALSTLARKRSKVNLDTIHSIASKTSVVRLSEGETPVAGNPTTLTHSPTLPVASNASSSFSDSIEVPRTAVVLASPEHHISTAIKQGDSDEIKTSSKSRSRASRTTGAQRMAILQGDPFVSKSIDESICGDSRGIYCVCTPGRRIALDRDWGLSNWNSHAKHCNARQGDKVPKALVKIEPKQKNTSTPTTQQKTKLSTFFIPISKRPAALESINRHDSTPDLRPEEISVQAVNKPACNPASQIVTLEHPMRGKPNKRLESYLNVPSTLEPKSFTSIDFEKGRDSQESELATQMERCVGLRGGRYTVYALQQPFGHSHGGIPAHQRSIEARRLFPYKDWPQLDDDPAKRKVVIQLSNAAPLSYDNSDNQPLRTNRSHKESQWTEHERLAIKFALDSCARWSVIPEDGSTCHKLEEDEGLKRALRQADKIDGLSETERAKKLHTQATHTPRRQYADQSIATQRALKHPAVVVSESCGWHDRAIYWIWK